MKQNSTLIIGCASIFILWKKGLKMSIQNGKCPNCGGSLLLDSLNEKAICKFCGSEFVVQQAIQKLQIDGIATFDVLFLTAQQA